MKQPDRLFTREFLSLSTIIFPTFCTIAVFFQFHQYLHQLPIRPELFGLLIGLFSFTALIVRPVISPLLHPGNARRWIFIGALGVIISLLLYGPARDFRLMAFVRILHGLFHVVLATALMSRVVGCIPMARSSQAFGLISVVTLLPYAVMPPLLVPLIRTLGGFIQVLYLTAFLVISIFPLLLLIKPADAGSGKGRGHRLTFRDMVEDLRDPGVSSLLILSLLLYTAYAPVFYFLKGFAQKAGISNPGLFFTLSTFTQIGVRISFGHLLDRFSKPRLLSCFMALLAGSYIVLAHTSGPVLFYALGFLFGLCWGVTMPVINGLMFDISPVRFRALNTNLSMEMFQGGFFLGPLMGGWILTGQGYPVLYYFCAALILMGLCLTFFLRVKG